MQVEIIKSGNYAIGGLNIISLKKGDVMGAGDSGLNTETLLRLVEIGHAVEVEKEEALSAPEIVIDSENQSSDSEEEVDYKKIKNKDELEAYARGKFSIELDKRRSLQNMFNELETKLKG